MCQRGQRRMSYDLSWPFLSLAPLFFLHFVFPFCDYPTTPLSVSSKDEVRHLLHEPGIRTKGMGGKEKMQWERGTAIVTEETDILFSHTWSKNTALRQKMLSEYSTHISGVNWFWAHNALVVKYLATKPVKSMSEILFCYTPENLQIFNAAVCTWRKNWSKV